MKDFDLIILGGGPGGYVAALRAAQYGRKVAIVEERELGGTCLNRGCIPTKYLLHIAELYEMTNRLAKDGVFKTQTDFDFHKIMERKDGTVKILRSGIENLLKKGKIEVFKGRGFLSGRNAVEIASATPQIITADNILIATGSVPLRPPIPGIDANGVITSDEALNLKTCPDKIMIIGGGVIGVEFATIFNSLGKEVVILEMMDEILPGIDSEVSRYLRKILEKSGIKIITSARVADISAGKQLKCSYESEGTIGCAQGEAVLLAIGRKTNTTGIGLENLGVVTEKGYIQVNDRMQTNVKGIYAIGDVTGKIQLAHLASAQGLVAAANIAGENKTMDYSVIPKCIYSHPEVAVVGLSEEEAKSKGLNVQSGIFPVGANGKSMILGANEGFAKIVSNKTTGEILGAQIIAPRATEMISEICVAMKSEAVIEEIADTVHPHPSVCEILMEAASDTHGLSIHSINKERKNEGK